MAASTIAPGKHRHYKGNFYEVLGVVIHSEHLEELVLYRALYGSEEFAAGTLWVRPLAMFAEKVWVEGREVDRFERVDQA